MRRGFSELVRRELLGTGCHGAFDEWSGFMRFTPFPWFTRPSSTIRPTTAHAPERGRAARSAWLAMRGVRPCPAAERVCGGWGMVLGSEEEQRREIMRLLWFANRTISRKIEDQLGEGRGEVAGSIGALTDVRGGDEIRKLRLNVLGGPASPLHESSQGSMFHQLDLNP